MTQTCPYCGWTFDPTPRHESERVLPYCSLGCRRLSTEKHVAYEERKCEYREQRDTGIMPPEHAPETLEGLADCTDDERSALTDFLREWMHLHQIVRDYIALRLLKIPLWSVGELREVTKQAVSKTVIRAVRGPQRRRVAALIGGPVDRSDGVGEFFAVDA